MDNIRDELSECDVGLSVRCFRLRSCRFSKIDDRCVDFLGSMIDVSTFEDG